MKSVERRCLWAYVGLSLFAIAGTVLSKSTGLDPGPVKPIVAAATVVCGFMAVFAPAARSSPKVWLGALAIIVIGAASELIGLYSGLPFGRYEYTQAWAPVIGLPGGKWFPLLLPVAWAMMAGSAYFACAGLGKYRLVGAALLASAADWLMEPVMVQRLGYWVWLDGGPLFGAPVSNVFGWFLVTLLAGFACSYFEKGKGESPDSAYVLAVHLGSMGIIGLI